MAETKKSKSTMFWTASIERNRRVHANISTMFQSNWEFSKASTFSSRYKLDSQDFDGPELKIVELQDFGACFNSCDFDGFGNVLDAAENLSAKATDYAKLVLLENFYVEMQTLETKPAPAVEPAGASLFVKFFDGDAGDEVIGDLIPALFMSDSFG